MEMNNVKNVIILKNLPSNILDEAIVVVKNKKKADIDCLKNRNKDDATQGYMNESDFKKIEAIEQDNREYVVKEAEMIIKNYIEKMEDGQKVIAKNKLQKKCKRLKYINAVLLIVSIMSTLICIAK